MAAVEHAPPLAGAFYAVRGLGGLCHRTEHIVPWENASLANNRRAEGGKPVAAGAAQAPGAMAGHMHHTAAFRVVLLLGLPTQERTQQTNSMILAGIRNLYEACRNLCICRCWCSRSHCSESFSSCNSGKQSMSVASGQPVAAAGEQLEGVRLPRRGHSRMGGDKLPPAGIGSHMGVAGLGSTDRYTVVGRHTAYAHRIVVGHHIEPGLGVRGLVVAGNAALMEVVDSRSGLLETRRTNSSGREGIFGLPMRIAAPDTAAARAHTL